jgi:prevent-host-death family protein
MEAPAVPSQVNIHEAKTHFSRLVDRAAKGEEIVIARAGRPVARLGPLAESAKPRRGGAWKGKVWIADDFDAPLDEEVEAAFRGERP